MLTHKNLLTTALLALSLSLSLTACGEDDEGGNEEEVITTVELTFTPSGGGTPLVFTASDPDGDGGAAPIIEPINLPAGQSFTLAVRFLNELETPAEDITVEVADEADDHQVFFSGSAVEGPATTNPGAPLLHAYADTDGGGLPIGLANTIMTNAGTGDLIITLRHLPPINATPVKTATTASEVASGGFAAIGGTTDASVVFPTTVP